MPENWVPHIQVKDMLTIPLHPSEKSVERTSSINSASGAGSPDKRPSLPMNALLSVSETDVLDFSSTPAIGMPPLVGESAQNRKNSSGWNWFSSQSSKKDKSSK